MEEVKAEKEIRTLRVLLKLMILATSRTFIGRPKIENRAQDEVWLRRPTYTVLRPVKYSV